MDCIFLVQSEDRTTAIRDAVNFCDTHQLTPFVLVELTYADPAIEWREGGMAILPNWHVVRASISWNEILEDLEGRDLCAEHVSKA